MRSLIRTKPHHAVYLPPLNSEVILGCIKYMYFIYAKMLVCIYTKTVFEMCLHYKRPTSFELHLTKKNIINTVSVNFVLTFFYFLLFHLQDSNPHLYNTAMSNRTLTSTHMPNVTTTTASNMVSKYTYRQCAKISHVSFV
jgi:hypothetical protein